MGNYKFRFSDIIPNAWFHKLKHLSKPRSNYSKTLNHTNNKPIVASSSLSSSSATIQQPHLSDKRKSYYLTRDLTFIPDSDTRNLVVEQPRKSSRRRRRRSTKRWPPRLVSKESTNSDHDQSSLSKPDSIFTESRSDKHMSRDSISSSDSSPCKCQVRNDIDKDNHHPLPLIKTMKNEATKLHQRTSADFSERNAYGSLSVKVVKEDFLAELVGPARKSSHGLVKVVKEDLASELISPARKSSQGVKLRVNSPKIANRRIQGRRSVSSNSSSSSQRSFSGGLAVVKASKDPRRDFKESMVEMIVENNIKASKDLEELLACYLSLNSDEYHDLIINVFKQIWFDYIHHNIK